MPLQTSGKISLSDIAKELGITIGTPISLGQASVRALLGKSTGAIAISDAYGKSTLKALAIPVVSATGQDRNVRFIVTNNNPVAVSIYQLNGTSLNWNGPYSLAANTAGIIDVPTGYKTSVSMVAYFTTTATGYVTTASGQSASVSATSHTQLSTPTIKTYVGGDRTISATWSGDASATSYDVSYDGKVFNVATAAFSTSYRADGTTALSDNTSYSIGVVAKASGFSTSNTMTQAITTSPRLATPVFTTTTIGAGSLTFNWGAVTNAASYDVTFDGVTANQTGVSFVKTGLEGNIAKTISVVAKASGYLNSETATKTDKPNQSTLPTPDLVASRSVKAVSFTWTAVAGVSYSGTVDGVAKTAMTSPISFTDSTGGVSHTVTVKASKTNYDDSTLASVTASTKYPAISKPTIAASEIKEKQMTITVTKVAGDVVTDYALYNGGGIKIRNNATGVFPLDSLNADTTLNFFAIITNPDSSSTSDTISPKTAAKLSVPTLSATAGDQKVTYTVTNSNAFDVSAYVSAISGTTWTTSAFSGPYSIGANKSITLDDNVGYAKDSVAVAMFKATGFTDTGNSSPATAKSFSQLATPIQAGSFGDATTIYTSWKPVTNATSYDVTFDGKIFNVLANGTSNINFIRSTRADGTTALSAGTAYPVSVVAKASGYSTSASLALTTPSTYAKLATPVFTTTTIGAGSLTFNWGAVTNATSYDVTFDGVKTNQTGVAFSKTGLEGNVSKSISVVAKYTGYYADSDPATKTDKPNAGKYATPTVTATAGVQKVSFAWTAETGVTYAGKILGVGIPAAGLTNPFVATDTAGKAGTTFSFELTASKTNYLTSDAGTASAVSKYPALSKPTIAATEIRETQIIVTATKATADIVNDYELRNGTNVKIDNNATGVFTVKSLANSTTYTYVVVTSNPDSTQTSNTITPKTLVGLTSPVVTATAGDKKVAFKISNTNAFDVSMYMSSNTGTTWVTTSPYNSPQSIAANKDVTIDVPSGYAENMTAVAYFTATGFTKTVNGTPATAKSFSQLETPLLYGTSATLASFTVSWRAVTGATSYDVTFDGKTVNQASTSFSATTLSNGTTTLSTGTDYSVSVVAKGTGYSNSSALSIPVKTQSPVAPNFGNCSVTETFITWSWDAPAGATGYEYSYDGGATVVTFTGTTNNLTVNGLTAGTSKKLSIRATFVGAKSAWSHKTVKTSSPIPKSTQITVHPVSSPHIAIWNTTLTTENSASTNECEKWFSFSPPITGSYAIALSATSTTVPLTYDTKVEVYDDAGLIVATDDDAGAYGPNSLIRSVSLTYGKKYNIRCHGNQGALNKPMSVGSAALTVFPSCDAVDMEKTGTTAAKTLAAGQGLSVRFYNPSTTTSMIGKSIKTIASGTAIDTYLVVMDRFGNVIGQNDDISPSKYSQVTGVTFTFGNQTYTSYYSDYFFITWCFHPSAAGSYKITVA
jgi:hypothetical protein